MDESEHAIALKKKREAKLRKIERERKKIMKSALQCFSTGDGKAVLRWLMKECGYQQPSVIYNAESGDIKFDATVYNEAKRDVYLRLRGLLLSDPKILAEVENNVKEN